MDYLHFSEQRHSWQVSEQLRAIVSGGLRGAHC